MLPVFSKNPRKMRGSLLFLLTILHTDFPSVDNRENGKRNQEDAKQEAPSTSRAGNRRLLAAVDRSISAADEAREARDELVRLAAVKQEASQ